MLLNYSWVWITEIIETKTSDKSRLLNFFPYLFVCKLFIKRNYFLSHTFIFVSLFLDRVFLCLKTLCFRLALNSQRSIASASQLLELKVCVTMLGYIFMINSSETQISNKLLWNSTQSNSSHFKITLNSEISHPSSLWNLSWIMVFLKSLPFYWFSQKIYRQH